MEHHENSFDAFKSDISELKPNAKTSLKSKIIFTLSLLSLWIPFVPSIIALVLIPSARQEIIESDGKVEGTKILKWSKGISWATIWLNMIGLVALVVMYFVAKDLLIQTCDINVYYCQFKQYLA